MLTRRRTRLRQQPARDWTAVSLGIITVATIIAAATVAAYINLAQASPPPTIPSQDALRLSTVPGIIAYISLWAYLGVVSTGLIVLFGTTDAEQRAIVRWTAIAFYAQVFAVVVFAWIIIRQSVA